MACFSVVAAYSCGAAPDLHGIPEHRNPHKKRKGAIATHVSRLHPFFFTSTGATPFSGVASYVAQSGLLAPDTSRSLPTFAVTALDFVRYSGGTAPDLHRIPLPCAPVIIPGACDKSTIGCCTATNSQGPQTCHLVRALPHPVPGSLHFLRLSAIAPK